MRAATSPWPATSAVKESVLPFNRFPGVDTILGPEMRSTGEVMGIDRAPSAWPSPSQPLAGDRLPLGGTVFFSLADRDKPVGVTGRGRFVDPGFSIRRHVGHRDVPRRAEIEEVTRRRQDRPDHSERAAGGQRPSTSSRAARWSCVVQLAQGPGPRAERCPHRRPGRHRPLPPPAGGQRHGRPRPARPPGPTAAGVPPRRRRPRGPACRAGGADGPRRTSPPPRSSGHASTSPPPSARSSWPTR